MTLFLGLYTQDMILCGNKWETCPVTRSCKRTYYNPRRWQRKPGWLQDTVLSNENWPSNKADHEANLSLANLVILSILLTNRTNKKSPELKILEWASQSHFYLRRNSECRSIRGNSNFFWKIYNMQFILSPEIWEHTDTWSHIVGLSWNLVLDCIFAVYVTNKISH